jgi:hypothetical protein
VATRTVRSLADLLQLLTPERQPKTTKDDPNKGWSPDIPCWKCMRLLSWRDAVQTVSGKAMGYGHPDGTCDPAAAAENARRVALIEAHHAARGL